MVKNAGNWIGLRGEMATLGGIAPADDGNPPAGSQTCPEHVRHDLTIQRCRGLLRLRS